MLACVSVGVILVSVSFVFAACCTLAARTFFFEVARKADFPLLLYGLVVFLLMVVGCRALGESHDDVAVAIYASALCVAAFVVGIFFYRSLDKAEQRDARQRAQLNDLLAAYREQERSVANRCVRLARDFDLTRREEDVLVLLAEGRTRSEMAKILFVSDNTVKTHMRNLYKKLKVGSKDELVAVIGSRCRETQA